MTPRYPNAKPSADTAPRWSKDQIRQARQVPLAPLLRARGLSLIEHEAENFEPAAYRGLLLKDNYWRWPERVASGNTIDFLTQVLKLSFHQAMTEIVAHTGTTPPPNPLGTP